MTDLCFCGALDIAARVRARTLSAVECLRYFQKRVERYNPDLNAIILVDWERAAQRALQADQALARGEAWGPFHGVPVTVKESFDLANHKTTWGDPAWKDHVARNDDAAVTRLERAGAIVFGKTNVPTRLLDMQTHNELFGISRNPWDLSMTPGGSSGGAAAALAAGLTGLELGSDLGGSLRQPAHCCGVFAHKPTFGLEGTHVTALGRHAITDMAVAGPNGAHCRRPAGRHVPILHASHPAAPHLPRGVDVERRRHGDSGCLPAPCRRVGAPRGDRVHHGLSRRGPAQRPLGLPGAAGRRLEPNRQHAGAPWEAARHDIRQRWAEYFQRWDVLIAPVSPVAAFPHDHSAVSTRKVAMNGHALPYEELLFWPSQASLAYLPSTAFPAGRTRAGLPIGLQVIGAHGNDALTMDVVRQVTNALGGFTPPPGFPD